MQVISIAELGSESKLQVISNAKLERESEKLKAELERESEIESRIRKR
jgi:hypothetical protein